MNKIKKLAFKKLVKEKIRIKAFHYLVQLQQTHNKSKNVKYEELKLQDYLSPKNEMTIRKILCFCSKNTNDGC